MYGMLASDTSLDPRFGQLEGIFASYLQLPLPEVRERILRKVHAKLRLHSALSVSKRTVSTVALLSRFLYRKAVLHLLVNGLLINPEVAAEETRLQLPLGQVIVKSLILAFNEGGHTEASANLHAHFLTLHALLGKMPDVLGLLDLIEENAP